MGEHAVVYGRPAPHRRHRPPPLHRPLPPPLGRRRASSASTSPGLSHHETLSWADLRAYARKLCVKRWEGYALRPARRGLPEAVRGEDPAHVVKVALGEVAELLEVSL